MEQAHQTRDFVRGMKEALRPEGTQWPFFFISTYKQCGLKETEAMIVLQLLAFQRQGNRFPLVEQIAERMTISPALIWDAMQKLLKLGYLVIEEGQEQGSGRRMESYHLTPLMDRALELFADQQLPQLSTNDSEPAKVSIKKQPVVAVAKEKSIFQVFEEEFGRLLSPMECDTISKWLDEDHYPIELIRHALRESVFAGKLHFRYIDRILLEWQQHKIRTVDDAKQHASKFRGR
jgi:DNA replication protein